MALPSRVAARAAVAAARSAARVWPQAATRSPQQGPFAGTAGAWLTPRWLRSAAGVCASGRSGGSGERERDKRGAHGTSVDPDEIKRFAKLSGKWWDPQGAFSALHQMNPARVSFIVSAVRGNIAVKPSPAGEHAPLHGLRALDVGCGGGLLCEPLARLGADVVGVEATGENVAAARRHGREDPSIAPRLSYLHTTVEEHVKGCGPAYDLVVASEVVEHVADVGQFVADCAAAVRPGGVLVMSTLNRTPLAYGLGILAAEGVLGLAPPGTHTYSKFVTPEELTAALGDAGMHVDEVHGMRFSPLSRRWSLCNSTSVNYIVSAVKPPGAGADGGA